MTASKESLIASVAFLVLLVFGISGGFYYYHTQTIEQLRNEESQRYEKLNNQLVENQRQYSEALVKLRDNLVDLLQSESTNLQKNIQTVQNFVDESNEQTNRNLQTITGKITQVETESKQQLKTFEDQIKKIKLTNSDFSSIVQEVLKAVVGVKTGSNFGSGVVIDSRGFILTNHHITQNRTDITVKTYTGQQISARVIGFDSTKDLALLKIDTNLNALAIDTNINVGEKVIAVGNPAGLDFSVSEGIVSSTARVNANNVKYVQTDVAVNPGSSGGPLVNIKGNIIGITTFKAKDFEGLGFAIHAEELITFSNPLIAANP